MDEIVLRLLKLDAGPRDLGRWTAMLDRMQNPADEVTIGLVGKYVEYEDSYKSLKEALLHGGLAHQLKVNIHWIEAEGVSGPEWESQLEGYDGILVPGGFGKRGIEGMMQRHPLRARAQGAVFRHLPGHADHGDRVRAQRLRPGGRRLHRVRPGHAAPRHLQAARAERRRRTGRHHAAGRVALPCWPKAASRTRAYGTREISERHRHRYEFNREYEERLTAAGLRITGETPDQTYVEICEIPGPSRGSWAASSIPSSSPSRWSRTRCSRRSSARPTNTAAGATGRR